ncbi:LVIVD repeat-containing protein [Spongiivirga citrea]|uniref:LVIVD repeat-containing protein n=1 Tax=Spongiivirga citrea TaxID=1481457 RepID=A0A6M0CRR6_9FLAO|nr:hypothetical protein [Spongiivirga citrea]NER18784.1 hypothetical protein [Spongiivirga citrea]
MKSIKLILLSLVVSFVGCDDNDDDGRYADYEVATAITMTRAEFRESVSIDPPQAIDESGKIYAYNNFIFVNDNSRGIHVIDNSNPVSPQKISFLKIPGNVDISIKDDVLFADSVTDLVVFDISNIKAIKQTNRLENVFPGQIIWPFEADIVEGIDHYYYNTDQIIVGWDIKTERRLIEETPTDIFIDVALNDFNAVPESGGTGDGGSLARFKIVGDYLYAVDSHSINVFGIQDLNNPTDLDDVYAGFDIETIFNRGDQLFLGSRRGMYIYDIKIPETPTLISEFEHGTACDPVVVDGDHAFVTLRGGNNCGALESGLFIVDISDIENPILQKEYPMDEPYGLGIKDEKIFICDGDSGLKVYDKTDVDNLKLLNHFNDINTFDVVPLQNHLLMIGDGVLYQYTYEQNSISLLSEFSLN